MKTRLFSALILTPLLFGGCNPLSTEEITSNLYSKLLSQGYAVEITDGGFVWNYEGYNTVPDESSSIRVIYYPTDRTEFDKSAMQDEGIQEVVYVVTEEFKKELQSSSENTINDHYQNIYSFGYANESVACLLNLPQFLSYEWQGQTAVHYADIKISCANLTAIQESFKKLKPFYDDLGIDPKESYISIAKEMDGFYHLNAGGISGGGWEVIVATVNGKLVEVYAGNSGDRPCEDMMKYSVPEEIYGSCYASADDWDLIDL